MTATNSAPVAIHDGPRGRIAIYADAAALAAAAAAAFARAVGDAVSTRGEAAVALSGGTTPRQMGELLAAEPYRSGVPWDRVAVFWGDERFVPLTDAESNAGTARRGWLDSLPVGPNRIFPWPTEGVTPEAAAMAYGRTVQEVVAGKPMPRFDLVLLGIGDDGHTASLFPGTAALRERNAVAVANLVPKLQSTRLTLTAPVLNAAREVIVLVGGAAKAAVLASVLEGEERPEELPVQMIRPAAGRLGWLVDRAAAANLREPDGVHRG